MPLGAEPATAERRAGGCGLRADVGARADVIGRMMPVERRMPDAGLGPHPVFGVRRAGGCGPRADSSAVLMTGWQEADAEGRMPDSPLWESPAFAPSGPGRFGRLSRLPAAFRAGPSGETPGENNSHLGSPFESGLPRHRKMWGRAQARVGGGCGGSARFEPRQRDQHTRRPLPAKRGSGTADRTENPTA